MKVTIDNLETATAQDVFETVARHLLTQNKKSTQDGHCCYRGEYGTKCAAGVLIPDERYDPKMDSRNSTGWDNIIYAYEFSTMHSSLINALQYLHDNNHPETWKEHLKHLARVESLNFDFIDLEF